MPRSPSSTPALPEAFRAARTQLILGAGVVAAGLAIAGTVDRGIGGVVLLVGWLLAMAGLHRVGRAGPG